MIRSLKKPWHGIGPRLACRTPRLGVPTAVDERPPLNRMRPGVVPNRSHGIRLSSPSTTCSSRPCPQTNRDVADLASISFPPAVNCPEVWAVRSKVEDVLKIFSRRIMTVVSRIISMVGGLVVMTNLICLTFELIPSKSQE
jgi:hypothetical protein